MPGRKPINNEPMVKKNFTISKEQAEYLKTLKNASEFLRDAIQEKREREK